MEKPVVLECTSATDVIATKERPENIPTKLTILGIWKDFGNRTSMHALGRAVHSKRIWLRLLWGVLVIGGACIAGRSVYETIDSYLTYPVTTLIELESYPDMEFPAVTICNLNQARIFAINKRTREALFQYSKQEPRRRTVLSMIQLFKTRKLYDTREDADKYIHYNMSDMLVGCTFDLKTCQVDQFKTVDNFKYGKCFTFTSGHDELPLKIGRPGNRNGLILELDIQQDNYLPFVSTPGVKVVLHPKNEMPFPEDNGIIAGPGRTTSIGIRKMTITRQPRPWGECIHNKDAKNSSLNMFGDDIKYSVAVCEKTCYQRSVVERCQCCDENYPCNKDALRRFAAIEGPLDICDDGLRPVLSCLENTRDAHASGLLSCMDMCFPSCKEEIYRTRYSTGTWPSKRFEKTLILKAEDSLKEIRAASSNPYPENITSDFVSQNFLKLEIYFENFVEERVLTKPAYDWNKLLSDIGGQLGLWLGFSIMTAAEILELLYDIIRFTLRRIRNCRQLPRNPGDTMPV